MSLSIDSAYKHVENLAAITVLEKIPSIKNDFVVAGKNKISVGGNEMKMTRTSIKQLCKILGIPDNFYINDNELWERIVKNLQTNVKKDVGVNLHYDTEKQMIVSLTKSTNKYVYDYVDLLSILDKSAPDKIYKSNDGYGLSLLYNTDHDLMFQSKVENRDVFKIMTNVDLYPFAGAGTSIDTSLQRMWCTNLSYQDAARFSQSIKDSRNDDYAGDILDALNYFKKEPTDGVLDYYNNKIQRMIDSYASYAEIESAHSKLKSVITQNAEHERMLKEYGMSFFVKDVNKFLPLEYIKSKYEGIVSDTKMPESKAKAKTPVCYYDMYNLLTYEGTHSEILTDSQKNDLKVYAGSLLSRNLDIGPEITAPDFSDFNLN